MVVLHYLDKLNVHRTLQILGWIIAFLLFGIDSNAQTASWDLKKEKDGIKVYTRNTTGSKLKDSKAVMEIPVSVERLTKELKKVSEYPNWMDKCEDSYTIEKKSDYEYYNYYRAPAPWPVDDRDVISRMVIRKGVRGRVIIHNQCKPDFIPKKKGIVRIKKYWSKWQFTPKDNGKTEVVLISSADPGGNVPDWMTNTASVDTPFKTFKGLKKRLGL